MYLVERPALPYWYIVKYSFQCYLYTAAYTKQTLNLHQSSVNILVLLGPTPVKLSSDRYKL